MGALTTAKVLFVLTSHGTMGTAATDQPTGAWFEEFSTPYYILQDAGVKVDIVSVAGGEVPIDPKSLRAESQNPESVNRFTQDPIAMAKIKATIAVDNIKTDNYDAVFLPGGHGTMWDMPQSKGLQQAIADAWTSNKVVAAVCHGVAGLVEVKDQQGKPIVQGKKLTGFSDAEETAMKKTVVVPFLLESRLRQLGGVYSSGENFKSHAVEDGNLITGQNPSSSEAVAKLMLKQLKAKYAK